MCRIRYRITYFTFKDKKSYIRKTRSSSSGDPFLWGFLGRLSSRKPPLIVVGCMTYTEVERRSTQLAGDGDGSPIVARPPRLACTRSSLHTYDIQPAYGGHEPMVDIPSCGEEHKPQQGRLLPSRDCVLWQCVVHAGVLGGHTSCRREHVYPAANSQRTDPGQCTSIKVE